jgi:hypothetical protein
VKQNYLTQAIYKFCPTAEFSFSDNDYATIKWDVLNGDAPTKAEVDAAIEQIKLEEAQVEIDKAVKKAALLDRLGLTEDEAKLLLS